MNISMKRFPINLLGLLLLASVSLQQEQSPSNTTTLNITKPSQSPLSQLLHDAATVRHFSENVTNQETFIESYETLHRIASLDNETLAQNLYTVWKINEHLSKINAAYVSLPNFQSTEYFAIGFNSTTKTHVIVLRYLAYADHPTPIGFSLSPEIDVANSTVEKLQFAENEVPDSSPFAISFDDPVQQVDNSYVIVVYPLNVSMYAVAIDNRAISRFRCVNVDAFKGKKKQADNLHVYFNPEITKLRGCALWSSELQKWSPTGCNFTYTPLRCECSLMGVDKVSILVYEYTDVSFDANLFAKIVGGTVKNSENLFLQESAELVNGISSLAVTGEVFSNTFLVYSKILSLATVVFKENTNLVGAICRGIEKITRRYATGNAHPIAERFKTKTEQTTSIAVIVLGFFPQSLPVDPRGFTLTIQKKKEDTELFNTMNITKILATNLAFACFFPSNTSLNQRRFIFAVYPIDKSIYPIEVSNRTIFRSRQIDIFATTTLTELSDYNPTMINFYFHLSPPKTYLNKRKSCIAWDTKRSLWRDKTCSLNSSNLYSLCSCNLTNTAVVRVMLYEYVVLKKPLPPIKTETVRGVQAQDAVFLIVSLFSLVGFAMIILTAIFLPQWRQPASNKALIHLTVSALLHLIMLWMRLIYDTNVNTSQRWIILHVVLNYTRLAHYCWQVAMVIAMTGAWFSPEVSPKVNLVAWAIPVLPLIALVSWNQRSHFFWPDRLAEYLLYLVPAFGIGLVNIALMASVVHKITNLFGLAKHEDAASGVAYDKEVAIGQLTTIILMFFFFGITTVFELIYELGGKTTTVAWLFKITAPAPGIMLCFLFIVFDSRTKSLWRMLRKSAERELSGEPQMREVAFEMTFMEGTYREL